jgi:hypothetical protein
VPAERQASVSSDLVGVKLTLFPAVGLLAVLAAFFFVGPVAGVVVLLAAVAMAGMPPSRRFVGLARPISLGAWEAC